MKNFLKENWFKLSFALAIILIGASVFYYFVIYLPQKEQMRIEADKQTEEMKIKAEQNKLEQERLDDLLKEQKIKQAEEDREEKLNACIATAANLYSDNWLNECIARVLSPKDCKKYKGIYSAFDYYEQYPTEKTSTSTIISLDDFNRFNEKKEACSCMLPKTIADSLGETAQTEKSNCYKQYPAN
jgi:preprotein translocase subunit YajC